MPRLCEFYPGICLTTEEKAQKTSVGLRKTSIRVLYTYYQKYPPITKPTQTHTLQNPLIHTRARTHTHTHTHTTKQYKTTTVQIKTNTMQDIPKLNSQYNQMPAV